MPDDGRHMHLSAETVAAYVDGADRFAGAERRTIEDHLLGCADCRGEVVAVGRLVRSVPRRGKWIVWAPFVAAAAAMLLFYVVPRHRAEDTAPVMREPAITTATPATPRAPRGQIDVLRSLMWSSVPHADKYRVRLFDGTGSLVWRTETADTLVLVPDTVRVARGVPYYWKVDARVEPGRWVSSDLTPFTLNRAFPP